MKKKLLKYFMNRSSWVSKLIDDRNNADKKCPSIVVTSGCLSDENSSTFAVWDGDIISIYDLQFDQHPIKI